MASSSPFKRDRSKQLPSDIWLHIITMRLEGPYEHRSIVLPLASVNRRMREIALPVLFNPIILCACLPKELTPMSDFGDRDHLEYVVKRIKGINSSPHILDVIHQLSLFDWSFPDLPQDLEGDRETEEEEDGHSSLTRRSYQALLELILNLPNLYHFESSDCNFPPALVAQVCRISNLRTLRLWRQITPLPVISLSIFRASIPSSLHVFEYHPFPLEGSSAHRPYEADILKLFIHLSGQFTTFSFPTYLLPDMLSDNNLPAVLIKLQNLSIFESRVHRGNGSAADYNNLKRYLYKFLERTPSLHELRIFDMSHPTEPLTFSPSLLPCLEILTAPTDIATEIAKERVLKKICITGVPSPAIPYTVISQDIEDVSYHGSLPDPETNLPHLACMFPNMTSLTIQLGITNYKVHSIPSLKVLIHLQISLMKFILQKMWDALMFVLPKLPRLKRCVIIHSYHKLTYLYLTPHRPNRNPSPFSIDDPTYRPHPTLEDIQFFSSRWVWEPVKGHWNKSYHNCNPRYITPYTDKHFFKSYIQRY